MKKIFYLAAIACISLFVSCEKSGVPHTGDETGTLYGVWALTTKTIITTDSNDKQSSEDVDYTSNHFYIALGEFPFPYVIAKKGSFTDFDLKDVDVDAARYTYNSDLKQISFTKLVLLTDENLSRSMSLSGTFDVLELSDTKLVIQHEEKLLGRTIKYSYKKQK